MTARGGGGSFPDRPVTGREQSRLLHPSQRGPRAGTAEDSELDALGGRHEMVSFTLHSDPRCGHREENTSVYHQLVDTPLADPELLTALSASGNQEWKGKMHHRLKKPNGLMLTQLFINIVLEANTRPV